MTTRKKATPRFEVGDVVRLNTEGRLHFPEDPDREGTVVRMAKRNLQIMWRGQRMAKRVPEHLLSNESSKFGVGQVVAILGFEDSDPRQFAKILADDGGFGYSLSVEIDGHIETRHYTHGELRPLTPRERGKKERES